MIEASQNYTPGQIAKEASELSSTRKATVDKVAWHTRHLPSLKAQEDHIMSSYLGDFGKYADPTLSPEVRQEKFRHQLLRLELLEKIDSQTAHVKCELTTAQSDLAVNETVSAEHYQANAISYHDAATALAELDGIKINSK